jgi:hypothetical protein
MDSSGDNNKGDDFLQQNSEDQFEQILEDTPAPQTRSGWITRAPSKYPRIIYDRVPEPLLPVPVVPVDPIPPRRRVILHVRDSFRTAINAFGLYREYPHRPTYDPEAIVAPEDLANYYPTLPQASSDIASIRADQQPPWPFNNMSIYHLMQWTNTGSNSKSESEINRLVRDVICADDFRVEDLRSFCVKTQNRKLDEPMHPPPHDAPFLSDAWQERTVKISIPTGTKSPTGVGYIYSVPGLHYRSLVAIIVAAFSDETSKYFHLSPFKRFWMPTGSVNATERIYDEVYCTDAFIDTHEALQKQPPEPGCTLERVVAGLMFWSDSTHVANFGVAKVWPIYLHFANLSKYLRAKSTTGACRHVAYIPSVCILAMIATRSLLKIVLAS